MKINSYWTQSMVFNGDIPNHHSLPSQTSQTSFYHLKLQPYGRQMAQHISWSQGHSTSPHISEPILQTFTSGVNRAWHKIGSEMCGLVEWSWLQLMCCAICLPHGHNFRWWKESLSGSEYWLVCCCWTLEIEFNKSLSLSVIRLVNYSITTSLIYKQKV